MLRPEESLIAAAPWHRGRIVLLGDAVHAITPHLGQGAAQAIEDGVVLAEALTEHDTLEAAFAAYTERRYERCKLIVETSVAIGEWEMGRRPTSTTSRRQITCSRSWPNPSDRPPRSAKRWDPTGPPLRRLVEEADDVFNRASNHTRSTRILAVSGESCRTPESSPELPMIVFPVLIRYFGFSIVGAIRREVGCISLLLA